VCFSQWVIITFVFLTKSISSHSSDLRTITFVFLQTNKLRTHPPVVRFPDMVFPTDMGIRSVAAFAWTPLMQYYEGTRDVKFLSEKAYPYLRSVVDFYSSYLRPNATDEWLHVPYSCGDEICG